MVIVIIKKSGCTCTLSETNVVFNEYFQVSVLSSATWDETQEDLLLLAV